MFSRTGYFTGDLSGAILSTLTKFELTLGSLVYRLEVNA